MHQIGTVSFLPQHRVHHAQQIRQILQMVFMVRLVLLPRTSNPCNRIGGNMSRATQSDLNAPPYLCVVCYGGHLSRERGAFLISVGKPLTCIDCGDEIAKKQAKKHTIAIPFNKGAYQYIHNPSDMVITNPKRTI